MKRVVVSAFIVNSRNRILMTRRKDSDKYCPPGGKAECGESLEEGLAREIKEETALIVSPNDMEYLGFCDLDEKVVFFYLIFTWAGEVKNLEPHKHGEWEWLPDTPQDRDCVEGIRSFNKYLRHEMHERIAARRAA